MVATPSRSEDEDDEEEEEEAGELPVLKVFGEECKGKTGRVSGREIGQ